MQAQRPAPPIPTMRKEVTTPEMTPSPTLKPELRMDNEISPMKPLPRPFSYEGPGEAAQGSPQQKEQEPKQQEKEVSSPAKEETIEASLPLRTTSLDPPEPSPSVRPMTAPAPHSTFSTTHPSLSTHALPSDTTTEAQEVPFVPLTDQSIPLPLTLVPRITPSQLSCYTSHATSVWSNNVFQPMGCMVCHSNEKERKFSCTWCQLRICRGCSEKLVAIPRRDLGRLLRMREMEEAKEMEGEGLRVVVEDVDFEDEVEVEEWEQDEEVEEERGGRGRSMSKGGSRARNQVVTPRE